MNENRNVENFMVSYFCPGVIKQSSSDQCLVQELYSRSTLTQLWPAATIMSWHFDVSVNIHEYQINSYSRCAVINDGCAGL